VALESAFREIVSIEDYEIPVYLIKCTIEVMINFILTFMNCVLKTFFKIAFVFEIECLLCC